MTASFGNYGRGCEFTMATSRRSKHICCVPSCTKELRQQMDNLSWHGFPQLKLFHKQKQKWTDVIRRLKEDENWVSSIASKICSRHFKPEDFVVRGCVAAGLGIGPASVPSLFLEANEKKALPSDSLFSATLGPISPVYDSDITDSTAENLPCGKSAYHSCCVPACTKLLRQETYNLSWHRFPRMKLLHKQKQKWIDVIRRLKEDEHWVPSSGSKICSRHFKSTDFVIRGDVGVGFGIGPVAVPTLFLDAEDKNELPRDPLRFSPTHGPISPVYDSEMSASIAENLPCEVSIPATMISGYINANEPYSEKNWWHCTCIVPACSAEDRKLVSNLSWLCFPPRHTSYKRQRDIWVELIRKVLGNATWNPTTETKICSRHFDDKCFLRYTKKIYTLPWGSPTLHLGDQIPFKQIPQAHREAFHETHPSLPYGMEKTAVVDYGNKWIRWSDGTNSTMSCDKFLSSKFITSRSPTAKVPPNGNPRRQLSTSENLENVDHDHCYIKNKREKKDVPVMTRCVICNELHQRIATPTLEKQLSVIFFLKHFLNYSLICEDKGVLEFWLMHQGNPQEWIQFCEPCSETVEEALKVYRSLMEVEKKLETLRNVVETKVSTSFENLGKETNYCDRENGQADTGTSFTVRQAIYKKVLDQKKKKLCLPFLEVNIKAECSSDTEIEWPVPFGSPEIADIDILPLPPLDIHSQVESSVSKDRDFLASDILPIENEELNTGLNEKTQSEEQPILISDKYLSQDFLNIPIKRHDSEIDYIRPFKTVIGKPKKTYLSKKSIGSQFS